MGADAMSGHPVNLAVRFLLELVALIALGMWGAAQAGGLWGAALALGIPVVAAAVWGIFRVPGDASSAGHAPVRVPGIVRLVLELALFDAATWALFDAGYGRAGTVLGVLVALHYAVSYDRVLWLVRGAPG